MPYEDLVSTYRSLSASETRILLEPILPSLGITRVANITGLDVLNIPIVTCIRPNAKHLSVSQGKGFSVELAEISAIMESIESYHLENPPASVLNGTFNELKNHHPLFDPNLLPISLFHYQSLEDYAFDWISAKDLISNKTVCLPWALASLDSTVPRPEYTFFNISTNGVAAGNTEEEAICHALYELIERDALVKWGQTDSSIRQNRLLDLSSLSGWNAELIQRYRDCHVPVKVWEITSDIKVPTYHCVIGDAIDSVNPHGIFTGHGTHLSKDIALSRALTEAAQARLTYISANRDDIFPDFYLRRGWESKSAPVDFSKGTLDFQHCLQPTFSLSFQDNLKQILELLNDIGHEKIFIINHTKKEFNIPVVQIITPTLLFKGARM